MEYEDRWGDWGNSFPEGVKLSVIVPVYNERYLVEALLGRLLRVSIRNVSQVEIVVVDDGSTDGSTEKVLRAAASDDRIRLIRHPANRGKGAAVRTGIEACSGDLIVFQDADLEYDPRDFAKLVVPFFADGADAVYGSRFAASDRRRVLYFRHSLGNKLLTFLSNLFTDLNLSDVETCYKMIRGPLLRSIPLRSNDFAMEIEITAKLAKRGCRVFEVPISYSGRTYREGKKIGWKDGVKALFAVVRFWLVDDLYRSDEYGGKILHSLERARQFNGWMADTIRPWIGDRVLEIGAGIGNITQWLIPRDDYLASDVNPNYLHYLKNFAAGKPYLRVAAIDIEDPGCFAGYREGFDTVVCLNVLEHVRDPNAALSNVFTALTKGGRLILYVPRGARLFSSLDEALGHRVRYEFSELKSQVESAGFKIERMGYFNRASVLGWWWNGRVRRRRTFSRWQLKLFDLFVPVLQRVDRFLPWKGLGLMVVARREGMV